MRARVPSGPSGYIAASRFLAPLCPCLAAFPGGVLYFDNAAQDFEDRISWAPFSTQRIQQELDGGKTVFVDVTASWCVTCIVNKRVVLESDVIFDQLNRADVVTLQADWTNPNDDIAAYLASHGRYAIPFNAVYSPSHRGGVLLPELLTEKAVLEAFSQVR